MSLTIAEELLKNGSLTEYADTVAAFLEWEGWPSYAEMVSRLGKAATQLEVMQAFLWRFIEIEEGTDQTGFDPHVEQMLMDLADEVRASLDQREG